MNVLFINTYFWGGGAEKVMRQLYYGLKDKEINTYCAVGRYQKNIPDEVAVIYKGFLERAVTTLLGMLFKNTLIYTPKARKKIIKYVRENKIDIIHFHNIHSNYFGLRELKAIARECPNIVITMHDMWTFTGGCAYTIGCNGWRESDCSSCQGNVSFKKSFLTKFILKEKINAFVEQDIHFVSPAKWLQIQSKESILNKEHIEVINNGADLNSYKVYDKWEMRKKYNIPLDKFVIIYAANGIKNVFKGYRYFCEILDNIKHKDEIIVLFVGNKPEDTINIPIDNMKFGYISSPQVMNELFSASDICAMTSIAEVYPLICIEAIASGTPVIAFDAGGIGEIIACRTGYIIPECDTVNYAKQLDSLINGNQSLYKGEKFDTSKVYSLKQMLNQYKELYSKILQ